MAVSLPVYTRGRLSSKITPMGYENILKILELQKDNGTIPQFERTIYDLSDEQIQSLRNDRELVITDKPSGKLEDYQTLAVGFMLHSKDCIIGDSVGLGKTAEIASLINIQTELNKRENKDFNYICLTEKTSVTDTTNKLLRFTGEYIDEVFGEAPDVQKFLDNNPVNEDEFYGGIVGTHSLIKNAKFQSWVREKNKTSKKEENKEYFIDLLIIDESKLLINSTSDMYKMASKLRAMCKNVILLNATPFENDLRSWYNQFNFLDPNLMPQYNMFAKRFIEYNPVTHRYDGGNGYKQPDVFKHEVSLKYFANTRRSLNATFENCEVILKENSLTPTQRKLLSNTSMPSMVFDCPQLLKPNLPFNPEIVSKLELLDEVIEENGLDDPNWADENPIIIYSYYKESHNLIQAYLDEEWGLSSEIINGNLTSKKQRQDIINRFRNKEFNVLITSIYRGLDLDVADTLVFYTFTSNPAIILQTEGRLTRSLNVKDKNFYILITKGKEKNKLKDAQVKMNHNNQHTNAELSLIGAFLLGEDI